MTTLSGGHFLDRFRLVYTRGAEEAPLSGRLKNLFVIKITQMKTSRLLKSLNETNNAFQLKGGCRGVRYNFIGSRFLDAEVFTLVIKWKRAGKTFLLVRKKRWYGQGESA